MDTSPSPRSTAPVVIAILLAIGPGIGALLGTMSNAEQFTVANLVLSPALALVSGILLGCRTGDSPGAKALHSLLWAVGAFGVSLGLQFMGCNAVNYRF